MDWFAKSKALEQFPNNIQENDDKSTFINIIINNNNNNNYMVNSGVSKLSKPHKPSGNQLSLVQAPNDSANQFLLDFTHKYDKKIYCHRKHLKELSYPDVPPNSFNFDEFDMVGFLDSIKHFQEQSHVPKTQNLNIMTIDNEQYLGDVQFLPQALNQMAILQNDPNLCSLNNEKVNDQSENGSESKNSFEKDHEVKQFKTSKDMKENATLQLRKIKFFWRGTQTNLPYIFKKIIFEKNIETGETEMFEKFEYSKKRIKTSGSDKS
jgi:hypothetical protein